MMEDLAALVSVRERAAYWQKRIQLETRAAKRQHLAMLAWAEIGRLVLTQGTEAFQSYGRSGTKFAEVMHQAITDVLRFDVSRRRKSKGTRVRAAGGLSS